MLNSKYYHIPSANSDLNLDLYILAAKDNEQKYPQCGSAEQRWGGGAGRARPIRSWWILGMDQHEVTQNSLLCLDTTPAL